MIEPMAEQVKFTMAKLLNNEKHLAVSNKIHGVEVDELIMGYG